MDGRKKTRREEKNKSRSKVESGKEERQKGSYSINGKRRSGRKKKIMLKRKGRSSVRKTASLLFCVGFDLHFCANLFCSFFCLFAAFICLQRSAFCSAFAPVGHRIQQF